MVNQAACHIDGAAHSIIDRAAICGRAMLHGAFYVGMGRTCLIVFRHSQLTEVVNSPAVCGRPQLDQLAAMEFKCSVRGDVYTAASVSIGIDSSSVSPVRGIRFLSSQLLSVFDISCLVYGHRAMAIYIDIPECRFRAAFEADRAAVCGRAPIANRVVIQKLRAAFSQPAFYAHRAALDCLTVSQGTVLIQVQRSGGDAYYAAVAAAAVGCIAGIGRTSCCVFTIRAICLVAAVERDHGSCQRSGSVIHDKQGSAVIAALKDGHIIPVPGLRGNYISFIILNLGDIGLPAVSGRKRLHEVIDAAGGSCCSYDDVIGRSVEHDLVGGRYHVVYQHLYGHRMIGIHGIVIALSCVIQRFVKRRERCLSDYILPTDIHILLNLAYIRNGVGYDDLRE